MILYVSMSLSLFLYLCIFWSKPRNMSILYLCIPVLFIISPPADFMEDGDECRVPLRAPNVVVVGGEAHNCHFPRGTCQAVKVRYSSSDTPTTVVLFAQTFHPFYLLNLLWASEP